jgi:hypothetical protein
MDLSPVPATSSPSTSRRSGAEPPAASPLAAAEVAVTLTPPDPWTEALAQLALAAGRVRYAVGADATSDKTTGGGDFAVAMAAHAVYLARRRVRGLEAALSEAAGDSSDGRVACWFPG